MALYTTLASLSQTAGSNAADGATDAPSTVDNNMNLLASFIAQLRDGVGFQAQLGTRNRVINGGFSVNQRAVTGTVVLAAGAYGHDRWKAGSGGCTYTFATVGVTTTLTISSGTLIQVIEGNNIEGGIYCMSWAGTAQGKIGAGAYSASGVNSLSLTAGANTTIEFSTGTLTNVQFELGTGATPFERRPFTYEEQLCKRYYQAVYAGVRFQATGAGQACSSQISFPVTMRGTPTLTLLTAGSATNAVGSQLAFTKNGFRYDITSGAAGDSFAIDWLYGLEAEL